MATTHEPKKTQVGDFLVWFCPQRRQLRMSDAAGQEHDFDDACFYRRELATTHHIYLEGLKALEA